MLLARAEALAQTHAAGRVPLLGLAGSQGSGKSTLAAAYAEGRRVAVLSLDDFYLGAEERTRLAAEVHPLLRTRGVPGTHEVALLADTIASLRAGGDTTIPVFDKLTDDRLPRERWRVFRGMPELILLEGWCLGALPQEEDALAEPVNVLEREWDTDGCWRRYVNARLAGDYAALFAEFDALVYLRAPDFARVVTWRCEQQRGLLGRVLNAAEVGEVADFVAYFERITRHMMAGGVRADIVAELAADRRITAFR